MTQVKMAWSDHFGATAGGSQNCSSGYPVRGDGISRQKGWDPDGIGRDLGV